MSPRRSHRLLSLAALPAFVGPVPAPDDLPTLEPLGAPVGCVACDDPRAFGAIQGLAVFADGGFAVLDRDEPMLRVFGADGGLETAFGRRGRGPGELSRPGALAATAGDELWVGDFMGTALTVYRRDGTFVETHPVESTAMALRTDATGRWLAWQVARWTTMSAEVHLRDADGGAETIPLVTTEGRILDEDGDAAAPGLLSIAPGPDGRVALGHGHTYRIEVVDRDGASLTTLTRDIPRTERTRAEVAELEEAFRRGPAGAAGNPEAGARRPEVDPLRPHFLLAGLAYDDRGRLWVRTARGGPERTVFDLFDPDGGFLGEVGVDAFLRDVTLGHGLLAAVVEDAATGVETVRRWRIVG